MRERTRKYIERMSRRADATQVIWTGRLVQSTAERPQSLPVLPELPESLEAQAERRTLQFIQAPEL